MQHILDKHCIVVVLYNYTYNRWKKITKKAISCLYHKPFFFFFIRGDVTKKNHFMILKGICFSYVAIMKTWSLIYIIRCTEMFFLFCFVLSLKNNENVLRRYIKSAASSQFLIKLFKNIKLYFRKVYSWFSRYHIAQPNTNCTLCFNITDILQFIYHPRST